jgi:hypothetical protein
MPVKHSPQKPRTPQKPLIDMEGGETEAEIEDITSNAEVLQRELQNIPQLTLRGDFQSPPTQALAASNGNGNGAAAGNGNGATAGNGNGNGAAARNGNGATAGNGNGNGAQAGQNGTKQKVPVTRGETEAMQRDRLAKEKAEQERLEFEEREEEKRRNIRRKEQEDLRWAKAMEEKEKRQREMDIRDERIERHAKESEERYQKRLEMEEAERIAREQRKKVQPLLNISPFVAITQPVSGGILKTPCTNASTPRTNVSTPRTTGYTPPSLSRPNSAVETSSYFKPIRGAAAPPPPVSKEREVGSKEWLQNFELGRQSTPICRPISILAKTLVSNTPFGRTANFSMDGYDETPVLKNLYVGGLTSERDLKEYYARKRFEEMQRAEEIEERAKEMMEESKELMRRKLEEENRRKLEEEQEHLRQLNEELRRKQAEDSETDTRSHIRHTDKVKRGIDRRRYLDRRRQRSKSGEKVESTTSEESLTVPFAKITKVLGRINQRYSDDEGREENDQLIGDINDRTIRDAFRKSLRPGEEAIEERLTSVLSHFLGDVERKLNERIDDEVLYRVGRIEDNERLSTRAAMEKKDSILPNIDYPTSDASNEVHIKAIAQMNQRVKVIEKGTTFSADPFLFAQCIAIESNIVARDFNLSMRQQRAMILSYLPISVPEYNILELNDTLEGLFSTISTFSTSIMTRSALEKAINDWMLDVSSERAMLMDWINKNRDTYNIGKPHIPSLMRDVITRVNRQSNIPRVVKEKLQEARLRIRDEDTLNECFQVVIAVLMIWVSMKGGSSTKVKSVKSISTDLGKMSLDGPSAPPKKKSAPKVQAVVSSPPAVDSKGPPPNKKPGIKGGDNKKGADGKGKGGGTKTDGHRWKEKGKDGYKKTKKAYFVRPWPENTPYLSKNGNCLSKEIEKHFADFCHKCGHSSHNASQCLTYKDKGTILTLCGTCRQGFHDTCRSRRADLQNEKVIKEVKKLLKKNDSAPTYVFPQYTVPPPNMTAPPLASESDSE